VAIATNAQKETLSTAYGAGTNQYISVHTGSPGSVGSLEYAGGSPAYIRKATTWTPGPSDGVNNGSQVTIDVGATTITHMGLWTAATNGTFLDSYALGTAQTFATQGQLLVTPSFTQT
jgi:hypothetical protein